MGNIAKHAGVSRQAVALWVKKPGFPPPVADLEPTEAGPILLWAPDDVKAWLAKNPPRIA